MSCIRFCYISGISTGYTAISKRLVPVLLHLASSMLHTKPEMYCGSYVNNVCMHIQKKIVPASYCEDRVWENSQSPYCCDLSLTPFTSPIVHFGLGMQDATCKMQQNSSPTFFEIAVYKILARYEAEIMHNILFFKVVLTMESYM